MVFLLWLPWLVPGLVSREAAERLWQERVSDASHLVPVRAAVAPAVRPAFERRPAHQLPERSGDLQALLGAELVSVNASEPRSAPRSPARLQPPLMAAGKPDKPGSPRLQPPLMFGNRPAESDPQMASEENAAKPSGLLAAGALASSAVLVEVLQVAGTAALLYAAQVYFGAEGPVEAVSSLIEYLQSLGGEGYLVFGALLIFLQIVPIAAAFVLTLSAGAIFGPVKGTVTVLVCSTISATISFVLARSLFRDQLLEMASGSKELAAIDQAFSDASFTTSLGLITLLRLSPVLPFAWANYVFGLTPVPVAAFSLGTAAGCFLPISAYVYAGKAGAEIAVNGADSNPALLGLGIVATLGAIYIAGDIATKALQDLDLNLE
jgi:uncharacterized membrane protein YdjX (TVP38/TMEM64 family)